MRTLKEEITYCREKGFHRNTIELSTMYAWLGERASEDDELKSLREERFQLKDQNIRMQNEIIELKNILRMRKINHD